MAGEVPDNEVSLENDLELQAAIDHDVAIINELAEGWEPWTPQRWEQQFPLQACVTLVNPADLT